MPMFKNIFKVKRERKFVDDVLVLDVIKIEVFTPDGKNYMTDITINKAEVPDLIELLNKYK